MEQTDAKLVDQYLTGEKNAIDDLVNRYIDPIYRLAFGLTGNAAEAEDITQEALIKVWKNLHKFDREKNFKTWVFTIARRTAIDWLRKRKHKSLEELEKIIADAAPLPDEILSKTELRAELEQALGQLPSDRRQIILLHSDDLTFAQIAQILGRPLNTVKSQFRRALHQIRGLIRIDSYESK